MVMHAICALGIVLSSAAPPRAAQPPSIHRVHGIGMELGMTFPEGMSPGWGAGVRGHYTYRAGSLQVRAGGTVGMSTSTRQGSGSDPRVGGNYSYVLDMFSLPILLEGAVAAPFWTSVIPYAGVSGGLTWIRATESSLGSTHTERQLAGTVRLCVGADFPLGPGSLFPEVRYSLTPISFLTAGNVNAGGWGLVLGYRFSL